MRAQHISISDQPPWSSTLCWLLIIPLVFFAAHGQFSFFNGAANSSLGQMSGSLITEDTSQSSGVLRLLRGLTYTILVSLLLLNFRSVSNAILAFKLPTFLAILAILSLAWSQAPLSTLRASSFYALDTLFAYYLVMTFNGKRLTELLMMVGTIVAVLSLGVIALYPRYGIDQGSGHAGSWQGLFLGKNVAAMFYVFFLTPALSFRKGQLTAGRVSYVLLMLSLIAMSRSRTAWILTLVYLGFMLAWTLLSRFSGKSKLLLVAFLTLTLASIAALAISYIPVLEDAVGRDSTLTGRSGIWLALLQSIAKKPLLGYGFRAFWTGLTGESSNVLLAVHWIFAYAHNGYIEVCLQLGLIGLAIVVAMLGDGIRNVSRSLGNISSRESDFYIGVMFLCVLYNIDEGTLAFPQTLLSILFVAVYCKLRIAGRTSKVITRAIWGTEKVLISSQLRSGATSLAR